MAPSLLWLALLATTDIPAAISTPTPSTTDPTTLLTQLEACAAAIGPANGRLEASSIAVAKLFLSYVAEDDTTEGRAAQADAIAAYHWRQSPIPSDTAAAAAIPSTELSGVVEVLGAAVAECERVKGGGYRRPPPPPVTLPLRPHGGFFVDAQNRTAYPTSFSQNPSFAVEAPTMKALGVTAAELYFVPITVLDSTACCKPKPFVAGDIQATLQNATNLGVPAFVSLGNGQEGHGKKTGSPVSHPS